MLTQNANNYQLIRTIPSTTESAFKNSIHHHFKQNFTIYLVTFNPFVVIVSVSPPFLVSHRLEKVCMLLVSCCFAFLNHIMVTRLDCKYQVTPSSIL
ncbi:hypothetical protein D6D22_01661 [Aureobasidium pullulans]|uniref:Uncharacterized protein n=1 Tax=Aureobasidium pullulans TaxID=5580 RepID=A0A4S8Y6P0_AURPU|nr:hypothetical protein D6D22_01661 [Aureobasidium pullulans]